MIDGKTAELTYTFGFTAKKKQTPRAVLVEDVTGASAVPLVEDQSPTLEAGGYWKGESTPRRAGDPSLVWLSTPGNTEKVFKFTITLADGRVEEIYQASLWSGQMKPVIKQALKLP